MANFNGGRSQINLNFLGANSGGYEFLNVLKTGVGWAEFATNLPVDPSTLDTNGYPTSFASGSGGVKQSIDIPSQSVRAGRYAVTWLGAGGITISSPSFTAATGSQSAGGGPGGTNRFEFLPTADGQINIGITTLGVTDLKVFHVADETALLAGNVFGDKFKTRLIEANCGVIRFLNWTGFGLTNWASRRPTTYAYYGGSEPRGSLYTGAKTGGSGNAYTASLSGFTLTDKAAVIVQFDRNATGSATLNISTTGAKPVLSPSASTPFNLIAANTYAYCVYDQTLDSWLVFGGDLNNSQYLGNGVPPEIMVQLCIECGAQFEPVTPYLTIDPVTDYMPSLAKYCLDNGPSWFNPHFGGVNEIFNFGAIPTNYAIQKATAYGWSDAMHNWMGKAMTNLGQVVSAVYGADRTKYEVLCGVQGATGTSLLQCQASDNRLKSAAYVAQVAAAQSPLVGAWGTITFSKDHAYNWVTGVQPANYFVPSDDFFAQGMIDAFDYNVTNAGNPTAQAANVTAFLVTMGGAAAIYNLAYVKNTFVQWKAWAAGMATPVLKVMPYEGGYSPDYGGTASGPCVAGITAATNAVMNVPSCVTNAVQNPGNPCVLRATQMRLVVSGLNGTMATLNGTTCNITGVSGNNVTTDLNTAGLAFASCTIAIGASAQINQTAHGFANFEQGFFTTTGALPTGFATNTLYFINVVDADHFTLSTTFGGTPITTSGTQSGTQAFCRTVSNAPTPLISIENSATYWTAFKKASKLAPDLGPYITQNYNDLLAAGALFPSCFQLSGGGNVWSVLDPDVYITSPSQWSAIVAFNQTRRAINLQMRIHG